MVVGDFSAAGICRHRHNGLVRWSGGDTVVCFHMPTHTKGAETYFFGRVKKGCWKKL